MHGLAGYFEANLYGGIELSIHPHRKDISSKDMLSWFPLFFPLRVRRSSFYEEEHSPEQSLQEPLYLPSNAEVQVSLWRLTSTRQVWYEWSAEAFLPVPRADLVPLAPARRASLVAQSPLPSHASLLSLSGSRSGALSPMIDADSSFSIASLPDVAPSSSAGRMTIVKIAQTGLHNPGGRSSWIGL